MLKKALMMSLTVGIGLAALHAVTAEAGGWQYVRPPGMWWYYGSVDGCATISQVRNPERHPALLRCDIELTEIETLCENPNNHDVRPGVAGTRVVALETIDPEDLLGKKEKGKANVCVGVDELSLDSEILCVNRNWNPIAALTTEFKATCTTEQCTGDDADPCATTVPQDTQVCACRLDGFTVEDVADGTLVRCDDPLHPDANCQAYTCEELDPVTLLGTGRECKLTE